MTLSDKTRAASDLLPGDKILDGWKRRGTIRSVEPSGRGLLKVTYDAIGTVNPPGIDYVKPDRQYQLDV